MNNLCKYILNSCLILLFFTSCNEVKKLKSSVRKTRTEVSLAKRTLSQIKNGIGLDKINEENNLKTDSADYLSLKQKNMLNNYGYIFDFINKGNEQIKSDNFTWDSIQNVYYVQNKNYKTIKPDREVFGWHPYWMGSKWENYPFELLSTIAYFSYKIDPFSGKYQNPAQIEEWNTFKMIDSAQAKNTRVLLTVSCHGFENNSEFLDNPDRWDVLIKSVSTLLLARNADGIDLNFEMLPYFKREKFNRFVKQLRTAFDNIYSNIDKEFYLSLSLPAHNSRDVFDIQELQKYTDLFIIMGYDYHVGGEAQGAVAPLRSSEGSSLSLSASLKDYIENGINPSKTILALPYYGSLWTGKLSESGNAVYNNTTFEKALTYSEIRKKYTDNSALKINAFRDDVSMTNYYNLTFEDNTTQEIWFDDDYTLRKKYDFALSNNLRGVGIWALGYDNGYDDLWSVIEDKFSTDKKIVKNPIAESEGYPMQFSKFILKYQTILVAVAIFFLLTVVLAFCVLLFDWNVRKSIIGSQLRFLLFVVTVFILLIPITIIIYTLFNHILPFANLFIKSQWIYYISFFVGVITMFFAYKIKLKPIKRP